MTIRRSVTLTDEEFKFAQDKGFSLTRLLKRAIKTEMDLHESVPDPSAQ